MCRAGQSGVNLCFRRRGLHFLLVGRSSLGGLAIRKWSPCGVEGDRKQYRVSYAAVGDNMELVIATYL